LLRLLQEIGGAGIVLEGAYFIFRDPNPDQVAPEIVALPQSMQGLTAT
jgi:hypothetical protein